MRKATDVVFHIGLVVKGVDALFEVAGGVLLSMPTRLARYLTLLAEHDVFRHHQALAGRIDHLAASVTMSPSMLEAGYLAVHGLAKVILITAIFMGKKWAYSGLFVILALFGLIEFGRAIFWREPVTAGLGLFDAALAILIYKEYRERFSVQRPESSA